MLLLVIGGIGMCKTSLAFLGLIVLPYEVAQGVPQQAFAVFEDTLSAFDVVLYCRIIAFHIDYSFTTS